MKLNRLPIIMTILGLYLFSPNMVKSNQLDSLDLAYYRNLADFFYLSREVPGHLELSLKNYLKAPNNKLLWKISRCYWFMGKSAVNSASRIQHFENGFKYGKKAVEFDGENPKSHLWFALSLGSAAIEKGVMKMIYQRDIIKASLEKTITLDSKDIDAYLGLASWYFYVPEILGGSKSKSFSLIKKAHSIDQNYTRTYLTKAEFLTKTRQFVQAKIVLKSLLKIKTPSSISGGIQDKANAANLLKNM